MPPLEYPTYATEEPAPRPELRRKDPNPCAVPQLVALIEEVRHIEANPKPAVLFRQVKIMGESDIDRIIARQFVCIRKPASQAAAIYKIRINCGVFAGIGSAGRNRIPLIMVQENPVVANEGEFIGAKKELTRDYLLSRRAFEGKIGVGIESALSIICGHFDTILISSGVVERRKDQCGPELALVDEVLGIFVIAIYAHRKRAGELLGHSNIKVIRALRFDRIVLQCRRLIRCANKLINRL